MKNLITNFLTTFFSAFLLVAGVLAANAQTLPSPLGTSDENPRPQKHFSETVRERNQNASFVLMTPEEGAQLLSAQSSSANLLGGGDPCNTAVQIGFNQSINGQLTVADCRLNDGTYADFYVFNGTAGQNITLALNSSAFDAYLGLANEAGTFVLEDNDGGGGTNARISTVLPATGLYVILANSNLPAQFGSYTLNLTSFAACTYSLNPTSATIAPEGGTFSFAINTGFGCSWSAGTQGPSFLSTTSSGNGPGTITYTAEPNGFSGTRTGYIFAGGQTFTVTQPAINCTFSVTPTSVTVPGAGVASGTVMLTTQPGCYWQATASDYFLWVRSSGTGPGLVDYQVSANTGASQRVATLTIGGQTVTITQPGLNCTYTTNPTSLSVSHGGAQQGYVVLNTQPGCTWYASGGQDWISLSAAGGVGSGDFQYTIYPNNTFATRTGRIRIFTGGDFFDLPVTQTGLPVYTRFDFDGDRKADFGFFTRSNGVWTILNSRDYRVSNTAFGTAEDAIAPADYDGDGLTDIGVFRPSTGVWYRLNSTDNSFSAVQFGQAGDIPVPNDYDGDGRADIAVYRPSTGVWYRLLSSNNQFLATQFGAPADKPQIGDFDSDGKGDLAVWRPSTGVWHILRSEDNGYAAVGWGLNGDIPAAADYDGDGKTDLAVYRPSAGMWYQIQSSTGQSLVSRFGTDQDQPVSADYDGDGKVDIGIYRSSTGGWWWQSSLSGNPSFSPFNTYGGVPLPSAFGQ